MENGGEVDGGRHAAYDGGHDGHDDEVAVYGTVEAGRIVGLSHGGQVERVIVSADGGLENRGSNAATTDGMPSLEERGEARVVRMKRRACYGAEIDGPYDLMRLRGAWTARHLALVFCDLICPRERERERGRFMP